MIKKHIYKAVLSLLLFSSCGSTVYVETRPQPQPARIYTPPLTQENPEPSNYQTFYDALAPFGNWVEDNEYGYVWVPDAGPDFQPYQSRGHWVYTSYGWTWVSYYQWGWATFHYGRWRFTGDYGWIWIPGYTWGPAWVAWRSNGEYFGWAPLGPPNPDQYSNYRDHESERVSIGLSFSFNDAPEPSHWCFVPANQIASPQINNYYLNRSQNRVIFQNTTIINNVTTINNINNSRNLNNTTNYNSFNNSIHNFHSGYIAGPPREDVERITGNRISPIAVSNSDKPGQTRVAGNSLVFYRPMIKNTDPNNGTTVNNPRPKQTLPLNQVIPVYNRNQEKGVGNRNEASNLSSTDNNPIEAARQRTQNPNPNFNQPVQGNVPNPRLQDPNPNDNKGGGGNPAGRFEPRGNNNPNPNNGNSIHGNQNNPQNQDNGIRNNGNLNYRNLNNPQDPNPSNPNNGNSNNSNPNIPQNQDNGNRINRNINNWNPNFRNLNYPQNPNPSNQNNGNPNPRNLNNGNPNPRNLNNGNPNIQNLNNGNTPSGNPNNNHNPGNPVQINKPNPPRPPVVNNRPKMIIKPVDKDKIIENNPVK